MLSGFMYSAPQKSIHENEAELNALSCEEMERVHKDVYGFGTYDIIENDDFICNRLIEFEHEIFKLSTTTKQAEWYLRGLQINPTYVNSNDLRLRFLRREFFNAKVNNSSNRFFLYVYARFKFSKNVSLKWMNNNETSSRSS